MWTVSPIFSLTLILVLCDVTITLFELWNEEHKLPSLLLFLESSTETEFWKEEFEARLPSLFLFRDSEDFRGWKSSSTMNPWSSWVKFLLLTILFGLFSSGKDRKIGGFTFFLAGAYLADFLNFSEKVSARDLAKHWVSGILLSFGSVIYLHEVFKNIKLIFKIYL